MTSTSRRTGRPTKLNPTVQEKICEYIAQGNYMSVAAYAAGVDDKTVQEWVNRAANPDMDSEGIYRAFCNALKNAEAEDEARRVARISKAGETNWLADMTHLERRYRERWGRPAPVQPVYNDNRVLQINQVTVIKDYGHGTPPERLQSVSEASQQIVEGEARELE